MRNFSRRTKIILLIFLTSSVTLSLTYESILKQMGNYLVLRQNPRKSDIIVVLNGRDTERSLAAVDLYKAGYASLIVLPRGSLQSGSKEFWSRINKDFNRKIFFQRAIEAMGVPEHAFELIGEGVTSTYDEAMVTQNFLRNNSYKSLIIVTSKWHSRRAYLTFLNLFKKDKNIQITIYPSRYDTFDPHKWWKKQVAAELVFREYVRLFYYIAMSRISAYSLFVPQQLITHNQNNCKSESKFENTLLSTGINEISAFFRSLVTSHRLLTLLRKQTLDYPLLF